MVSCHAGNFRLHPPRSRPAAAQSSQVSAKQSPKIYVKEDPMNCGIYNLYSHSHQQEKGGKKHLIGSASYFQDSVYKNAGRAKLNVINECTMTLSPPHPTKNKSQTVHHSPNIIYQQKDNKMCYGSNCKQTLLIILGRQNRMKSMKYYKNHMRTTNRFSLPPKHFPS